MAHSGDSVTVPRIWLSMLLLGVGLAPRAGRGQTVPQADRVRLEEGMQLADRICEQVWPGWNHTTFQVLLVGDSAEYLIGGQQDPAGFTPVGYDTALGSEVWTRPRHFPPTLLATFPAVGGVPTIVIGSAERTGKSSTAWVTTLLHEHFHQWQYSLPGYNAGVARLELARGDTTGQWMLDYPFPYDSAPVQRAMGSLATSLLDALESRPEKRQAALRAVSENRETLHHLLAAPDDRYFEFQLWQEGVARFIEYATGQAAAAARKPSPAFRRLPDYEPYGRTAEDALRKLRLELARLDLGRQRRVAFYPIGAALALLLDDTRADWKQAYTRQPFTLPDLRPGGH